MKTNEMIAVAALFVMVALMAFVAGPLDQGPTARATYAEDFSIFHEVKPDLKDPDDVVTDFEEHEQTVQMIHDVAQEQGIPDPYVFIGQLYIESDYFAEAPVRCEDSYERYWSQVRSRCSGGSNSCDDHPWHVTYERCQMLDGECDSRIHCEPAGGGGSPCSFQGTAQTTESFHRVACSYGLGQITYPVALELGYRGTAKELLEDDRINVELSAKHFMRGFDSFQDQPNPLVDAIIAYNAGIGHVRRGEMPEITKRYIERYYELKE